ncbi:hypothetical protein PYCCODRAFT_1364382 [Trametes coccinea BRFM310]|uniref:Uncharacterized protein n=1 Tax=Trametes coccinea (strain BRFM310) TaxID=1353009 RepID=A0A1Y2ISZ3_TRAC3|nr:hypothetical protein PYCCODRAFT_1364382 [Trametes coccinea BRFM310]
MIRYKTHNTPQQLSMLTDFSLESAGVAEKELRKQVLAAVRKAGYKGKASPSKVAGPSKSAAPSSSSAAEPGFLKPQRKRKRDDDLNDLLPSRPREEADVYGSLEFNEILDEEAIKSKYTVVNRAPIMMAWAFVVAERLGFGREEALSIASVYTEMNAVTKGVSLGIYKDGEQRGREASRTGSQPYVELMGRRWLDFLALAALNTWPAPRCLDVDLLSIPYQNVRPSTRRAADAAQRSPLARPLYQTASSQWHALSSGKPAPPAAAFSYITRALRQTAPHIVGALRLLAASYPPSELNEKGFSLYADFRPASEGWGQKGEVRCSTILALRKAGGGSTEGAHTDTASADRLVKLDPEEPNAPPGNAPQAEEPAAKKLKLAPKPESQEKDEYDAALDDDALFNDFDLSSIP